MSHVPPTREFRQVLAQLEMLSHGSVQSWNKSSPPSDLDRSPRGENFPPHERFRVDWEIADSDGGRAQVMRRAREFLEDHTKRTAPRPAHESDGMAERVIEEGEGWSAGEVAQSLKITTKQVMQARIAAGLDPSTGRVTPPDEDPGDQARRLAGRGVSVGDIARYQRRPKQTVSDCLKRAA